MAPLEGQELLEGWTLAWGPELEWGRAQGPGSEPKGARELGLEPREEPKLGLRAGLGLEPTWGQGPTGVQKRAPAPGPRLRPKGDSSRK